MRRSVQTSHLLNADLFSAGPKTCATEDAEDIGLAMLGAEQISNRLMNDLHIRPDIVAMALAEKAAKLILHFDDGVY